MIVVDVNLAALVEASPLPRKAIREVVRTRSDVFVFMPTGFGKNIVETHGYVQKYQ